MKRALSCLLVLVSLVLVFSFNTSAAGTQPSVYSDQYNSGTRHVTCTTLNGTGASSYYTGSYTYDTLSSQSASVLLQSLRTLMTNTHTKSTSYADCKNYSDNTDCQNEDRTVVLLYTDYVATMSDWISGNKGWNREHVWPQSLGGFETSGPGSDLHHIRPTDQRINSTRGNNKYGNVSGGKTATGTTTVNGISGGTYGSGYFEPHDNVKGDVARICLYIYARYGGSWSKCSSITNVFQSVDVLLEWCELDPVDTWEMGRNEVVEAIQGNRNVFIDYPEYAWLLFGREVPEDLVTPSGGAGNGGSSTPACTHTSTTLKNQQAATCTQKGYTGDTYCKTCDKKLSSGQDIPATGHKDSNGDKKCDTCGISTETPSTSGSYVKVTDGVLVSGQYILVTANGYAPGALDGTWISVVQPVISGNKVTDTKDAVWTLTVSGSSVVLTDANGVSVAPKGGNTNGIQAGSYSWSWTYDASAGGFLFQGTGSDTVFLAANASETGYNRYRAYKESTVTGSYAAEYYRVFTLYKLSTDNSGSNTCNHSNTEVRNKKDATCTTAGYSGDTYCKTCGTLVKQGNTVSATGHKNTEIQNKKDATCAAAGYSGDTYCKTCNQKISSGKTISATGHTDKNNDGKCDTCKTTLSSNVPPTTEVTTPPTTEETVPPTTEETTPPTTEETAPPTTEEATPPTTEETTPPTTEHEHRYGNWIAADGVFIRACVDCGHMETLVSESDPNPAPAQKPNLLPYILIGVVILAGITVTVILLVKRRKK